MGPSRHFSVKLIVDMSLQGNTVETTPETFVLPSVVAAAHELKTPLVLLRQLSLQLSEAEGLDERSRIIHERMRLTAERSLRLVEGITRAASLEQSLLESEPIELQSLLVDVAHELSPLASQLGHQFDVRTPRRSICLVGHREFLSALMLSLCDNALTYSQPGEPIRLSGMVRDNKVRLAVRDHGPVMSRTRFSQLTGKLGQPQKPSGHARSSGLGLWIADSFARTMESELQVERHRGGGLTFSVALPRSQQLSLL